MPVATEEKFSTEEIEQTAEELHEKVGDTKTRFECRIFAPKILEIERLKKKKNAVILGHNYQVPEVFHGISDFTGDSLGLSNKAAESDADIIVFCGVNFMAESAKIMNPDKKVLLPSRKAGCSLSESITGEDVRQLKEAHPGVPVVTYVNTTAEVKAESDYCCTSANALSVIEHVDSDRVIFIPDEYLSENVARKTDKEIITWDGRCVVHEEFTPQDIQYHRNTFDDLAVLAHPECSSDVVDEADFTGSTSEMIDYVGTVDHDQIMMITECSMSDNVKEKYPDKQFVSTCVTCPHMKEITLDRTLKCLREEEPEIQVPEDVRVRAKEALDRMVEIGRG